MFSLVSRPPVSHLLAQGCALFLALFLSVCPPAQAHTLFRSPGLEPPDGLTLPAWLDSLRPAESPAVLDIIEPATGALVPADAASPIFRWEHTGTGLWLVTMTAGSATVCQGIVNEASWVPGKELWAAIRETAMNRPVTVRVAGIDASGTLVSRGRTSFAVSPDPAGADIAFLRKRLPFRTAKDNPYDSQVVMGDLSSFGKPRVVLQDQPLCFNCHAYSADGKTYGMDMDYKGDKGGYVLVDVKKHTSVDDDDVISWNDYHAPGPAKYSMGLFTSLSPDGRFAASTVGESSAFVMLDDLYFSQMFYPATGQIAYYDRATGVVAPLPGADRVELVQTNPTFSSDGTRLAFVRAQVRPDLVKAIGEGVLRKEDPKQNILEVNAKYPVQFSLYSMEFNQGRGGVPTPIIGASDNGMSNVFPRYSPDGKWLVFTQCRTGLVLQPDSRLVIVPANGGKPRVLKANTPLMNSWHSWSPNSRWLAFAAKGNSPYTEVYLTHIDDNGRSSPSLRLFRFSHPELAAMVPEFVPRNSAKQITMELADPEGAKGNSMATDGR